MSQSLAERFRHISVDLETFGTGTDAAIVSIGAVAFNPETGEVNDVDVFHCRVDLAKSDSPGVIDPSTVEWWLKQSDEARKALTSGNRFPLDQALGLFYGWAARFSQGVKHHAETDDSIQVWYKPPTFDEDILKDAYKRNRMIFPFHYRTPRCLRTFTKVAQDLVGYTLLPFDGVAHDALADATHQAREVISIYERFNSRLQ